jgi:hypothetical protein
MLGVTKVATDREAEHPGVEVHKGIEIGDEDL